MATFNRMVAIVLWIALLAICLFVAAAPLQAVAQGQMWLEQLQGALLARQTENPTNFIVAQAALGISGLLLFGTLIGMEWLSGQRRGVRVRTVEGSSVQLDSDSVARRLAWHLDQLAEIISVVPSVRSRGSAVDIRLEVETAPNIDVPMKTDEVVDVTREIIEQDMGLKLGKLDVHMRYAPFGPDWT